MFVNLHFSILFVIKRNSIINLSFDVFVTSTKSTEKSFIFYLFFVLFLYWNDFEFFFSLFHCFISSLRLVIRSFVFRFNSSFIQRLQQAHTKKPSNRSLDRSTINYIREKFYFIAFRNSINIEFMARWHTFYLYFVLY
jgi:hypothetical protein